MARFEIVQWVEVKNLVVFEAKDLEEARQLVWDAYDAEMLPDAVVSELKATISFDDELLSEVVDEKI